MIELEPAQFAQARPLLRDLREHNLIVDSILEGHTHGRVWVDDAAQPRTAVVWSTLDALLFGGDPDNGRFREPFCALLHDTLMPDAQARGVPYFTLQAEGVNWFAALPQICAERLEPVGRRVFQWRGTRLQAAQLLPEGMALRALDGAFLQRTGLANLPAVRGWVDSFWPSHAAFERLGLGHAVVDGDAVASWCLSVYAAGRQRELGLETAVSHRNRGLATVAAVACLEQCRAQGLTPHWQCDLDNRPSLAVAAKIGFVPLRDTTAYRFWFDQM